MFCVLNNKEGQTGHISIIYEPSQGTTNNFGFRPGLNRAVQPQKQVHGTTPAAVITKYKRSFGSSENVQKEKYCNSWPRAHRCLCYALTMQAKPLERATKELR